MSDIEQQPEDDHEPLIIPVSPGSIQNDNSEHAAVYVQNLHLSYDRSNKVLNSVNMHVPKGCIYGLLGPSGTGKTTLLKCIIGRLSYAPGGTLKVLGMNPGEPGSSVPGKGVGYMPQELALSNEFTVHESLVFYGKLYQIPQQEFEKREAFLLEFLDIAALKDRMVKNCSGGQQRRVSLAVAMIHNPDILILDEPTVGVDPLLRARIWEYLVKIASEEHKTVIITTHYIEEARQANIVGLMRGGKILAESEPDSLIRSYAEESLESVFLKLCQAQDLNEKEESSNEEKEPVGVGRLSQVNIEEPAKRCFDIKCRIPRLFVIASLTWSNVVKLSRQIMLLIFIFLLPAIQVSLFCIAIGRDPVDLPLFVVNEDKGPIGGLLTSNIITQTNIHVMNSNFLSYEDAVSRSKKGEAWGVVYLYPSFTTCLIQKMSASGSVTDEVVENATVHVRLDMSNSQNAMFLYQQINNVFLMTAQELLQETGKDPKIASLPVELDEPIYGRKDMSFSDYIAPGMVVNIVFGQSIGLTAIGIVIVKKEGILDRLWSAGAYPIELVAAQVITQAFTLTVQIIIMLTVILGLFKVHLEGSIILVIIVIFLLGFSGMMYGLLISSLVNEEREAVQVALGSFFPFLLLSGVIWPIEAIPEVVRHFSYCLPTTWAAEAMRSVFNRGWDADYRNVWMGMLVPGIWLTVFFLLAVRMLKSKD